MFRLFIIALIVALSHSFVFAQTMEKTSHETDWCITCHRNLTPGIVASWKKSTHAKMTVEKALEKKGLARKVSSTDIPEKLTKVVVGCYECHGLRAEEHTDNFKHNGSRINVVVTPKDCAVCHSVEATQFSKSKKAHAHDNLVKNPVFSKLMTAVASKDGRKPTTDTMNVTCFACHGAKVEVIGKESISRGIPVMVPKLSNWPNQGIGRQNPDGSKGSCSACHPRHTFSIEVARKPHTCSQCHLEPDFPAWNVYRESKHGNIVISNPEECDWKAVPWQAGEHFTAPSCATCHMSLLADSKGRELVGRDHNLGNRLWARLAGFVHSTPQPKSGMTHIIKNADGLPLPTTFDNREASEFLIDKEEQAARREKMTAVCTSCHSTLWTRGHFNRLDGTIAETNEMTLKATKLVEQAWQHGLVNKENPFDEPFEYDWVRCWLYYGNSIRYGAAMAGPDYSTFKNGWADLTDKVSAMEQKLKKSTAATSSSK